MAYKSFGPETATVDEAVSVSSITFEMEGLVVNGDGSFTLHGVPVVDMPTHVVFEMLVNAGIPKFQAGNYTDDFAEMVHERELGRFLAGRINLSSR